MIYFFQGKAETAQCSVRLYGNCRKHCVMKMKIGITVNLTLI